MTNVTFFFEFKKPIVLPATLTVLYILLRTLLRTQLGPDLSGSAINFNVLHTKVFRKLMINYFSTNYLLLHNTVCRIRYNISLSIDGIFKTASHGRNL